MGTTGGQHRAVHLGHGILQRFFRSASQSLGTFTFLDLFEREQQLPICGRAGMIH